ncbi:MAG: precorrin-2 dehydrogenase/sirohydrochlorin ferrochelatase family protein [Bacillota bacterium]
MFLDITDRNCLVIGGGQVALRKIKRLLKYQADITVLSPEIIPGINKLLSPEDIIQEKYQKKYCQESYLIFAATNKEDINKKIARDAREKGIPVNVADNLKECDFIVPSVVKNGDLQIAISSGGKSPALSRKIRQDIENRYNNDYESKTELLGELREIIKEEIQEENKRRVIFNKMAELAQMKEGKN